MAYDLWGSSPLYENENLKEDRIPPVTPIDQVRGEGNCGEVLKMAILHAISRKSYWRLSRVAPTLVR